MKRNNEKKEFYTLKEVANILELTLPHIYYLKNSGVLKAKKQRIKPTTTAKVWKVAHQEVEELKTKLAMDAVVD